MADVPMAGPERPGGPDGSAAAPQGPEPGAGTSPLAAFTAELRAVVDVLDPEAGWLAAFARRAPEEFDAWLGGRELPPWDVVADLLQDLAVRWGTETAERTGWRVRRRYETCARAHDAHPGGREELTRRLDLLERAQQEQDARERTLADEARRARLAGRPREAERLASLRLWARDDAERLRARRAEVRARLAAAAPATAPTPPPASTAPSSPPPAASPPDSPPQTAASPPPASPDPAPADHRPKPARRPRGARYGGLDERATPDPSPAPLPAPGPRTAPPPRGSRLAGAASEAPARPRPEPATPADRQAAAETAARLHRLRAAGHGGEAYALLCAAVAGPPARLPLLLAELERTGLVPDQATLLWEAASLPPTRLAAAADALAEAGRQRDCAQLLRQGAARPAAEAGEVAAELWEAGRDTEAVTLLAALVRSRPAQEAVSAATQAPGVVAPLLLDAAERVSPRHHWAVTSELRRAGVA